MPDSTDGFIGLFEVPQEGKLKVVIDGSFTFSIEERVKAKGNTTESIAEFNITDLDILLGTITNVVIEWQREGTAQFVKLINFATSLIGPVKKDNPDSSVPVSFIGEYSGVPTGTHSFKAAFTNGDGDIATFAAGGTATQTTSKLFNGIDDLAELAAVDNLKCTSAPAQENDSATASVIPSPIAKLSWDDMSKHITVSNWKMGTVTDYKNDNPPTTYSTSITQLTSPTITVDQWKSFTLYDVFMFISNTEELPFYKFPIGRNENTLRNDISGIDTKPDGTTIRGKWFLVSTTKSTFIDVDLPKTKKVAFWVGARPNVVATATINPAREVSPTKAVPKISAQEYKEGII